VEHEEKATSKAAAAAAHPDGRANETDKRRRHIRREFPKFTEISQYSLYFSKTFRTIPQKEAPPVPNFRK
jgi:hypothetical protein